MIHFWGIFKHCDDMSVFSLLQERLTRLVSISLVGNPNLEDPNNGKRKEIIELCQQVSSFDPEFICKVCMIFLGSCHQSQVVWYFPGYFSSYRFHPWIPFLPFEVEIIFHLVSFARVSCFSSALRRFSSSSWEKLFQSFLLWLLKRRLHSVQKWVKK